MYQEIIESKQLNDRLSSTSDRESAVNTLRELASAIENNPDGIEFNMSFAYMADPQTMTVGSCNVMHSPVVGEHGCTEAYDITSASVLTAYSAIINELAVNFDDFKETGNGVDDGDGLSIWFGPERDNEDHLIELYCQGGEE